MGTFGVYMTDEEAAVVKAKPKGWAREALLAALSREQDPSPGDLEYTVFLSKEEASYVDSKPPGWLKRAVLVNMELQRTKYGEQEEWKGKPPWKFDVKTGEISENHR